MAKIAVLTGGGDCPGLNAVIRAVVRRSEEYGLEVMGIREGWRGLLDPPIHERLNRERVRGILHLGGTVLGTSRVTPFKKDADGKDRVDEVLRHIERLNIEAIIAIGGEGTLNVAYKLSELGVKVVGVPKTIDNDIPGTDLTFGFDTAVTIATEAIDRLHSTAEAHSRLMIVEVMGRHAGWIATYCGIAGGADIVLVPEHPIDLDAVSDSLARRHTKTNFSIVVVAEGARMKVGGKAFGRPRLGGIAQVLADELENRLKIETRVSVLGHVQRGGSPTAFDRVLATRLGVAAVDFVHQDRFGSLAALRGKDVVAVPLSIVAGKLKTVDEDIYDVARVFFA
jgi:ATP-dependent phosphofructokinase / diphosphate-dependent phosphofructokinase